MDDGTINREAEMSQTAAVSPLYVPLGHRIQVSLHLADPSAASCVCPDGVNVRYSAVTAAHGDSVLIQICIEEGHRRNTAGDFVYRAGTIDDFIYNAGTAIYPLWPPTLSLLRPYYLAKEVYPQHSGSVRRCLVTSATGLRRHGDEELVIAALMSRRESPRLQYLPLPADPRMDHETNRNVCITAGGSMLKFVNIFHRSCCGGEGPTRCARSHYAYTINTWTLSMENMEWVKDGMVDATELWALDAYKGLPCIPLDRPVVSMDEPHVICFLLCEVNHNKYGDHTLWVLMVDMRSKTIRSVSHYPGELWMTPMETLVPSNVSYYLNSYGDDGGTSMGQRQVDIETQPVAIIDGQLTRSEASNNPMLHSCGKSSEEPNVVQVSEIYEALEEIPSYGLDNDDMLKAYTILSVNKGRRFRSFLRLPLNLRKEWLLMEIKDSEA
ncbi:unnamed protein product [Urochloa decumbens]|uniref:DUF1618 domain-containing protein n=1 Tax=Urochloa decumbens TaxID=240449 RepID=A0ABC9B6J2_9POAL